MSGRSPNTNISSAAGGSGVSSVSTHPSSSSSRLESTSALAAPSAVDASASASIAPPPTKGLLLRVKRKRHEAPLSTLVVSSTRSEKRVAVEDLRDAFHQLTHSGTEDVANSTAHQVASSAAFKASAADSSGATVPAVPITPSDTSTALFRSRPSGQRVFKLLTTISAPKEQHANNDKIQVSRMRALAEHACP
jgi:hypothetical protein